MGQSHVLETCDVAVSVYRCVMSSDVFAVTSLGIIMYYSYAEA